MYDEKFQREHLIRNRRLYASKYGVLAMDGPLALDAQAQLATSASSGIPAFMSTFVDRDVLQVLFAPMEAAGIYEEERKVGDWVTKTSMFPVVEHTGEVSSYGDYSENGAAGANISFPNRQSYHYQTVVQYGEKEVDVVALAGINLIAEKKEGGVLALNKFQNRSYLFGINGLQNYGVTNDPQLTAALQPGPKAFGAAAHGPWVTSGVITATPNEILVDIQTLYWTLVKQSTGNIQLTMKSPLTLVMDPATEVALTSANSFGVDVFDLLKKHFPNIRFHTVPEYATSAGNLVQMIATTAGGQKTGFMSFTEKLRAHRLVTQMSSWKMKISQGTWGSILRQPWAVVQMLGV